MNWMVITGPTASGKTRLAVSVARKVSGEILSIDSRQVFRGMDIGTGKDLEDYGSGESSVPYHLIDIADPGEDYHVTAFQRDFSLAVEDVTSRGNICVLCGGSGLYLEAVLEGHQFTFVPVDPELRMQLGSLDKAALIEKIDSGNPLPYPVDTSSRKRMIRAIEIRQYLDHEHVKPKKNTPESIPEIFILDLPREVRRSRISERLRKRLAEGLVGEVELLRTHVPDDVLIRYGLEYKYVVLYLNGSLSFEQMSTQLETSIHRFAKRQMTWFRRMERKYGQKVHWIDATRPLDSMAEEIVQLYQKS